MTITVTNLEQGPFTATGEEQTIAYTFMTLSDREIEVLYGDDRTALDPSHYAVNRNLDLRDDPIEGGEIVIEEGRVPAGAPVWLLANPYTQRHEIWSNAGSRLSNLNLEQDRDLLRHLKLKAEVAKAVDAADDLAGAVTAAENAADRAEAASDQVIFPLRLYGSGSSVVGAPVPLSLRQRYEGRAVVNMADFGVKMYNPDLSVHNNQAQLQDAIDKLQPVNGVLFAYNMGAKDGSGLVLTGPLVVRDGMHNGKNLDGCGMTIEGESSGALDSWQNSRYNIGQGFKLSTGSTEPLILSKKGAGHLVLKNLMLDANQCDARCLDFENAYDLPRYGMGGHLTNVFIRGAKRNGLHIGGNRGRGETHCVWVEYCGAGDGTTTYPAWAQNSYDWEHYSVGVGVNAGIGIYVGPVAQVRFFGGASWMNDVAVVVSEYCSDVDFTSFHFDNSDRQNLIVYPYTERADGRQGSRRFIGCMFSNASLETNNGYPSIRLMPNCIEAVFVAPDFMGAHANETNIAKYCVEADAGAEFWTDMVPAAMTGDNRPFRTAFINDWSRLRINGVRGTGLGIGNGGANVEVRANNSRVASFGADQTFIGGPVVGSAIVSMVAEDGSRESRVALASGPWGAAQVKAKSETRADVDLVLGGQGAGMVVLDAPYAAGAPTPDGYIRLKLADGSIVRVAVDKE